MKRNEEETCRIRQVDGCHFDEVRVRVAEEVVVDEFVGKNVVIDVESPFVYVGRLQEVRDRTLVLKNADVHDLRDSTTTREIYVRDVRVHGIQPNRRTVHVRLDKVISIAVLDDVIP